jgi:hypothetical protein
MRLSIELDSVIKFEIADSCFSNEKPARVEIVRPKINAVMDRKDGTTASESLSHRDMGESFRTQ